MPPQHKATASIPRNNRSAVSNGRKLFVDGDARGPWARRWRDLVAELVDQVGGADLVTPAQLALVHAAATLRIELEQMAGLRSKGEEIDLDVYGRNAGQLRRLLETLGLERRAKPVQSLSDYVSKVAAA